MTAIDENVRKMIRGDYESSSPLRANGIFVRDQNLVVRAGAGSGKTTVLVARMTALIRTGVPVSELAAITFTRKAAGEMRTKFFSHLHAVESSLRTSLEAATLPDLHRVELARERARVRRALDEIDSVFIDTIHAFCQMVLRERPFSAGLSPDFVLVDERDEKVMSQSFWIQFLRQELEADPRTLKRFDRLGIDPAQCYSYFRTRCAFLGYDFGNGSVSRPSYKSALVEVNRFLDEAISFIPRTGKRDALMLAFDRADRFRRLFPLSEDSRVVEFLEMFDNLVSPDGELKSQSITLNRWSAEKSSEAYLFAKQLKGSRDEFSSLVQLVRNHVRPVLLAWRQFLYPELEQFVARAVHDYFQHRAKEGKLTFRDLLQMTADLFRESTSARRHFSRRFSRILVDEFQDTDPLQAEILFLLTAENDSEIYWQKCRPRPGSLMIVGDDKQAIYRFRGADVGLFSNCAEILKQGGGRNLVLTSNFRSTAALSEWINNALSPEFAAESYPWQAKYAPLEVARPDTVEDPPVMALTIPRLSRHNPETIARQEADRIAATIRSCLDGNCLSKGTGSSDVPDHAQYKNEDFLILTRVGTRMHIYVEALQRHGIPFETAGSKSLKHSRWLRPVVDLLDVVHDPENRVSLIAFLRGPLCGISDRTLLKWYQESECLSLESSLPQNLDLDDQCALMEAQVFLRTAKSALYRWPVAQAMEHIIVRCGLLSNAATGECGSSESGDLLKILILLRAWESRGRNWLQARRDLKRLMDGEIEQEGLTLEAGLGNAVRLYNIHQAKGLEARIVFLADPNPFEKRFTACFHVDRSGNSPTAVIPVDRPHGHHMVRIAEPVRWKEALEDERRYAAAEDVRLRYVAATRAKDTLIVSRYAGKEEVGFWSPFYRSLSVVPELPTGTGRSSASDGSRMVSFRTARAELNSNRSVLKVLHEPSREHIRPSDSGEESEEVVPMMDESPRGRGRGYGRAIHRLFETAVNYLRHGLEMDDAFWCRRLIVDEEAGSSPEQKKYLIREARESLVAFRESLVWKHLTSAGKVFTELPFSYLRDHPGKDSIVSGVMDLVYERDGTWHVVDYKTDRLGGPALLRHYSAQLWVYASACEQLIGAKEISAGIWSVSENKLLEVPRS